MEEDIEVIVNPDEIKNRLNSFYDNVETEGQLVETENENEEPEDDNKPAEEEVHDESNNQVEEQKQEKQEKEEQVEDENIEQPKGKNAALFSQLTKFLKNNSLIFDNIDDIDEVQDADAFIKLFDTVVEKRAGDTVTRINKALNAGVVPDTIKRYQNVKENLDNISLEQLTEDSENGQKTRFYLIYNAKIQQGLSPEEAQEYAKFTFSNGTDVSNAKKSLDILKKVNEQFIEQETQKVIDERNKAIEKQQSEEQKVFDGIRDSITKMDKFGDVDITQDIKDYALDFMSNRSELSLDGKTKVTKLQNYIERNYADFVKNFSLFMAMTNGGKTFDKIINKQVRKKTKASFDELDNALREASADLDGNLVQLGVDGRDLDLVARSGNRINFENIL